jgi:hypothetical protein
VDLLAWYKQVEQQVLCCGRRKLHIISFAHSNRELRLTRTRGASWRSAPSFAVFNHSTGPFVLPSDTTVWAMSAAEALLLEWTLRCTLQESALEQGWLLVEMEQSFGYGCRFSLLMAVALLII